MAIDEDGFLECDPVEWKVRFRDITQKAYALGLQEQFFCQLGVNDDAGIMRGHSELLEMLGGTPEHRRDVYLRGIDEHYERGKSAVRGRDEYLE